jgi:hypothetical protein
VIGAPTTPTPTGLFAIIGAWPSPPTAFLGSWVLALTAHSEVLHQFDDIKTGLGLGIGHHSAWRRSAIVTNVDWIAKAYRMFAWMTPGEVEVYGLDQLEKAKNWVAA